MDSSNYPKDMYEQALRQSGLKFTEIDVVAPELHGDHFASAVDYITVHQGTDDVLELFAKRTMKNSAYADNLAQLNVFGKESGFFNVLLPVLEDFIRERVGDNYKLDMIPKCYFANEETIVQENVVKRGYILLDKFEKQTVEQATLVPNLWPNFTRRPMSYYRRKQGRMTF